MSVESSRSWDLLQQLVEQRQSQAKKPEQVEEQEVEDLEEAAEAARRLLVSPEFIRLRATALKDLGEDFVRWLKLEPGTNGFEQELKGLHYRASSKFDEIFYPEEILKRAKDVAVKLEAARMAEPGPRDRTDKIRRK